MGHANRKLKRVFREQRYSPTETAIFYELMDEEGRVWDRRIWDVLLNKPIRAVRRKTRPYEFKSWRKSYSRGVKA